MTIYVLCMDSYNLDLNGLTLAIGSAFFAVLMVMVDGIPFGISIFGWPFAVASIFSSGITVFGFVKHKRNYGQILAVLGISCWLFLGVMALGQGG